jgi:hypothetical protein
MAVLLKNIFISNILQGIKPIAYIDSLSTNHYIEKMDEVMINYIKMNTITNEMIKKEDFIALNEKDIRDNKSDGLWILRNEKNLNVTLFRKKTSHGVVYNDVYVEKIFVLTCEKCEKFIPLNKESHTNTQQISLSPMCLNLNLIISQAHVHHARKNNNTQINDVQKPIDTEKSTHLNDFTTELTQRIKSYHEKNLNGIDKQKYIEQQIQSNATKKNYHVNNFSSELTNKVNEYRERNKF